MPHPAKNHAAMQKCVCAVCFHKPKSLRNISDKVKISIQEAVLPGFDTAPWSWLPTAICDGCYKELRDIKDNPGYAKYV